MRSFIVHPCRHLGGGHRARGSASPPNREHYLNCLPHWHLRRPSFQPRRSGRGPAPHAPVRVGDHHWPCDREHRDRVSLVLPLTSAPHSNKGVRGDEPLSVWHGTHRLGRVRRAPAAASDWGNGAGSHWGQPSSVPKAQARSIQISVSQIQCFHCIRR